MFELYDLGQSLDLAVAFNPQVTALRTSFGSGPREIHAIWRALLHGVRGVIVWDEANDVVADDGAARPRGRELAALLPQLRAVAGPLWAASPRRSDVAILYSQASFRLRWLLDRSAGARWWERDAERGNDDNAWRAARRQLADRLDQLGIAPRWLSTQGLEAGEPAGVRVVILPHVLSLSDTELAALRTFAGRGGRVLADTEPGLFDGHGRRRAAFPLEGVATTPQPLRPDPEPTTAATLGNFAVLLGPGPIALLAPDGQPATGVDIHLFDAAGATLLSMQTMAPYAGPPRVTIVLPQPASITDLRTGRALGRTARLDLALDPIEPTVLRLEP